LLASRASVRLSSVPEDDASRLRRALDVDTNLGGAGDSAAKQLEELQAARAKRLEAMGAALEIPPPTAPKPRGQFSISNAAASSEKAAEALARMRRRETGELEQLHADDIERAIRSSKSWLDAGLPERARSELNEVEKYCTLTTDVGAGFHLLLAGVRDQCGEPMQAKQLRLRVAEKANSSSQRWQAQQALEKSGGSAPSSSPSKPAEASRLFNMPSSWD